MGLAEKLVEAFEFAKTANGPDFRPILLEAIEEPISELLYLIVECSLFVREYVRHDMFAGAYSFITLSSCTDDYVGRLLRQHKYKSRLANYEKRIRTRKNELREGLETQTQRLIAHEWNKSSMLALNSTSTLAHSSYL